MTQTVFAFFCLVLCYGLNSGPLSRCVHFPLSCTPASKRKDIWSLDVSACGLWSYLLQQAKCCCNSCRQDCVGRGRFTSWQQKAKGSGSQGTGFKVMAPVTCHSLNQSLSPKDSNTSQSVAASDQSFNTHGMHSRSKLALDIHQHLH